MPPPARTRPRPPWPVAPGSAPRVHLGGRTTGSGKRSPHAGARSDTAATATAASADVRADDMTASSLAVPVSLKGDTRVGTVTFAYRGACPSGALAVPGVTAVR